MDGHIMFLIFFVNIYVGVLFWLDMRLNKEPEISKQQTDNSFTNSPVLPLFLSTSTENPRHLTKKLPQLLVGDVSDLFTKASLFQYLEVEP